MWLRRKYHRINDFCTVGNNFNQNSVWKVFSIHQTARTVIKRFPLPQYSESGSKNCHVERKGCNYTVLGQNSKSCQIYSQPILFLGASLWGKDGSERYEVESWPLGKFPNTPCYLSFPSSLNLSTYQILSMCCT